MHSLNSAVGAVDAAGAAHRIAVDVGAAGANLAVEGPSFEEVFDAANRQQASVWGITLCRRLCSNPQDKI